MSPGENLFYPPPMAVTELLPLKQYQQICWEVVFLIPISKTPAFSL
jgi:hypothetical protein